MLLNSWEKIDSPYLLGKQKNIRVKIIFKIKGLVFMWSHCIVLLHIKCILSIIRLAIIFIGMISFYQKLVICQ